MITIFTKRKLESHEPAHVTKEVAMYPCQRPCKEQVREWLHHEVAERRPPPEMAEIRRQLGWELIEMEREERHRLGQ